MTTIWHTNENIWCKLIITRFNKWNHQTQPGWWRIFYLDPGVPVVEYDDTDSQLFAHDGLRRHLHFDVEVPCRVILCKYRHIHLHIAAWCNTRGRNEAPRLWNRWHRKFIKTLLKILVLQVSSYACSTWP